MEVNIDLHGVDGSDHGDGRSMATFPERCATATRIYLGSEALMLRLVPGLRLIRREWTAGDMNGDKGKSFKINADTGVCKDFADGEKGCADLVALHHRIYKTPTMLASLLEMEREAGIDPGAGYGLPARRVARVREIIKTPWDNLPDKPAKRLDKASPGTKGAHVVKEWAYSDESGEALFVAQRWEAPGCQKTFLQKPAPGHEDLKKRYVPLYLPKVREAIAAGQPVYLVEGEAKCDALWGLGVCATTFIGGAKHTKALTEGVEYLQGADLYAIQDCDTAGDDWLKTLKTGCETFNVSLKAITLPAPKFKGYDAGDWVAEGGDAEALAGLARLAATLVELVPEGEPREPSRRPLLVDPADYTADRDLAEPYKPYDWMFENNFLRAQLGAFVAPGGCGKGALALEASLCAAAGLPVFGVWRVAKPTNVLYLAAEDDEVQLHNRARAIIQKLKITKEAAMRVVRVPVRGQTALFREVRTPEGGQAILPTQAFEDLRRLIEASRAELVILDTAACFLGVEENDNVKITACCAHLNGLIDDYKCNILFAHHCGKPAGPKAGGEYVCKGEDVENLLNQHMARGASAFAASMRWMAGMLPLSKKYAAKLFDLNEGEVEGGQYIVAKVVKKNVGSPEGPFYLKKGTYGTLTRVEPPTADGRAAGERLTKFVNFQRAQNYRVSAGGADTFSTDPAYFAAAKSYALEHGLLVLAKAEHGASFLDATEAGAALGENFNG